MLRSGQDNVDADLAVVLGRSWTSMTHREVLSDLVLSGWTPSGVGDWAIAVRSPSGRFAARICPFDPAYSAFVELCDRRAGNPYLPRVYFSTDLDGGGTLTVIEYLGRAPQPAAAKLAHAWKHDDGDADLRALKEEATILNAEYSARTPWWDGIDFNEDNVRQSADGQLSVIDIFCLDGAALYAQVLRDATVVRNQIPLDQCRHVLDIPYIARESTSEEIRALQTAWTG